MIYIVRDVVLDMLTVLYVTGIRAEDERESSELDAIDRANTAPAKTVRRNWLANSINLKTSRGKKVKIRAPSKLLRYG